MDPIFGKAFDTQKWIKYGTWLVSAIVFMLIGVVIGAVVSAHYRASRATANNIAALESITSQSLTLRLTPPVAGELAKMQSNSKTVAAVKPQQVALNQAAPLSNLRPLVVTVKNRDSLPKIFKRLGYKTKDAHKLIALNHDTRSLSNLLQGQKIIILLDPAKKMRQISYAPDILTTLNITCNKGCASAVKHIQPKERLEYLSGHLFGSINSAAKRIGLNRKLVGQLASAFRSQINLARLHKGDKIALFYKSYYVNGKKYRDGDLAAAVITHKNKKYKVVAFTDPHGKTDFYTADGYNQVPPFDRNPVNYKRISSAFSYNRFHPILHFSRPHLGVDLAANYGTPVKATSDGHIVFAGSKTGLGKAIELQHNQYRTVYGHLSGFAKSIHAGSYVKKGQVIAYVGSTGLSDGPHLHYEFRINNVPYDPMRVKLPSGEMIASNYRRQFFSLSRTLLAQLDTRSRHLAMAETEKKTTSQY